MIKELQTMLHQSMKLKLLRLNNIDLKNIFRTTEKSPDLVGFVIDLLEMDEKRKSDVSQHSEGQQKSVWSR